MAERLKAVESNQAERRLVAARSRQLVSTVALVLIGFSVVAATLYWLASSFVNTEPTSSELSLGDSDQYIPKASAVNADSPLGLNNDIEQSGDDVYGKAEFEDNFALYQSKYKDPVNVLSEQAWSSIRSDEIERAVDQASEFYARAEYSMANQAMLAIVERAQALLDEQVEIENEILEKIKAAFEAGSQAGVQQNLRALESVSPDQPLLPQLTQSLSILPELLELNNKVTRYASENRPELELQALERLSELGALNTEQQARQAELIDQMANNNLDRLIAQTRNALTAQDTQRAQSVLNQAKKLGGGSAQMRLLQEEITAVNRTQSIRQSLTKAARYAERDQWESAAVEYQTVLGVDSTNAGAIDGLAAAQAISGLLSRQARLLDRPLRVADSNVNQYAKQLVSDSNQWLNKSARLVSSVSDLEALLVKVAVKKPVQFLSDGRSTIKIQGVGFIQPMTSKVIQLNPGEYTVFATCDQAFETVANLLVPLEGSANPIEVVCGKGI